MEESTHIQDLAVLLPKAYVDHLVEGQVGFGIRSERGSEKIANPCWQ